MPENQASVPHQLLKAASNMASYEKVSKQSQGSPEVKQSNEVNPKPEFLKP